jgi:hypothetical protein
LIFIARDMRGGYPRRCVSYGPIVLKKSKMPRQQNSRKSESTANFGWRVKQGH